jgi:hypothetical protein
VQAFGSQMLYGAGKARHDDHSLAIYEAAGFTGEQAGQAAATVFTFVLGNALGLAAAASLNRRLSRDGGNAGELIRDLDNAIQSFCGRVPGAAEKDDIMATILGKTLVDEYEHVLRRCERAVRDNAEADDRININRLMLLYKLKKTERLMACLDLLHAKTAELARKKEPGRKDCTFLLELWEKLERFGIEDRYRENSALLKTALQRAV